MSKDNSEPAFPAPEASMEHYGKADGYTGMSLRDYFAGQAVAGMFSPGIWPKHEHMLTAAKAAYMLADAMLAARSA